MSSKKAKMQVKQVDPAELAAARGRMKTELVQGYADNIRTGERGTVEIAKALSKIIARTKAAVSENSSPEGGRNLPGDAAKLLAQYRDALILLNVLQGAEERESASVNRNIAAVAPVLTGRVATRKAGQKGARDEKSAATASTRKVEKAMAAAKEAQAKANAIAAALERGNSPNSVAASVVSSRTVKARKQIVSPERLGMLIAKHGRSEARTAELEKLIGPVREHQEGEAKPLKYILRTLEALETQALRFNPKAKADFSAEIEEKMATLQVGLKKAKRKGSLTAKAEADTIVKIAALKRLFDAIEAETNVEASPENKPVKEKKKRTHKVMKCKILRHPCNSKVIVTKEQLKAAVDEIMEKGYATPPPGTEGMMSASANTSRASSVASSRAPSAAPSPAGSDNE
jgi:hypothetical protein